MGHSSSRFGCVQAIALDQWHQLHTTGDDGGDSSDESKDGSVVGEQRDSVEVHLYVERLQGGLDEGSRGRAGSSSVEHVEEASEGYEGDRKVNGCGMNWMTRNVSLERT